ncbi:unnamed protein product [Amoebophrya sp. A120]|nr:unnamed protein product [Amoebophrya sp. A120]|eukprot:GSA120T00009150001.1
MATRFSTSSLSSLILKLCLVYHVFVRLLLTLLHDFPDYQIGFIRSVAVVLNVFCFFINAAFGVTPRILAGAGAGSVAKNKTSSRTRASDGDHQDVEVMGRAPELSGLAPVAGVQEIKPAGRQASVGDLEVDPPNAEDCTRSMARKEIVETFGEMNEEDASGLEDDTSPPAEDGPRQLHAKKFSPDVVESLQLLARMGFVFSQVLYGFGCVGYFVFLYTMFGDLFYPGDKLYPVDGRRTTQLSAEESPMQQLLSTDSHAASSLSRISGEAREENFDSLSVHAAHRAAKLVGIEKYFQTFASIFTCLSAVFGAIIADLMIDEVQDHQSDAHSHGDSFARKFCLERVVRTLSLPQDDNTAKKNK